MTIQDLIYLAQQPVPPDSRLKGRDDSNPYYDFLYQAARELKPNLIVELGTDSAGSTTFLAFGAPQARVITIDQVDSATIRQTIAPFPNIEFWSRNTNDPLLQGELTDRGPIDLLFIDTEHSYDQAWGEYLNYAPLVRSGGIILYDDIDLHDGMKRFWGQIPEPKISLPHLHWTGFGASIKA